MELVCRFDFGDLTKAPVKSLATAVDDLTNTANVKVRLQEPEAVRKEPVMSSIFKRGANSLYLFIEGERNDPMGALDTLQRKLRASDRAFTILG